MIMSNQKLLQKEGMLVNQTWQISDCDRDEVGTRDRLLSVAEQLFAEKGFTHATVQEITGRAGCNISAINYHFHGKDELYLEVFRRLLSTLKEEGAGMLGRFPSGARDGLDLEGLLERFARAFVGPFLEEGTGLRLMKLIMKEREDPHLPQDFFLTEVIEPIRRAMMTNLKRICPHLDDARADMCLQSIVGQLLYLIHTLEASRGANGPQATSLETDRDVAHIVAFSAAGIRHFLEQSHPC